MDLWQRAAKHLQHHCGRPSERHAVISRKIPESQVWEIVAYVRSMSGQLPKDVSPGREDHMYTKRPEASTPKEHPPQTNVPPGQKQK